MTSSTFSLSLTLGSRVMVGGIKSGQLRYFGRVHFAEGEWCGVELDEAEGLHDGAVGGVRYFACARMCGIFAPRFKVTSEQQQQHQQLQQKQQHRPLSQTESQRQRGRGVGGGRGRRLTRENISNSLEDLSSAVEGGEPTDYNKVSGHVTLRRPRSSSIRPSSSSSSPSGVITGEDNDTASRTTTTRQYHQHPPPSPQRSNRLRKVGGEGCMGTRPWSALVTPSWSFEVTVGSEHHESDDGLGRVGGVLKHSLSSSREKTQKRVTFDDEYYGQDDEFLLQRSATETKITKLDRQEQEEQRQGRLKETQLFDNRKNKPSNIDLDADFEKYLDIELRDVMTPPDVGDDDSLLKSSDESVNSLEQFRIIEAGMKDNVKQRRHDQSAQDPHDVTASAPDRKRSKHKLKKEASDRGYGVGSGKKDSGTIKRMSIILMPEGRDQELVGTLHTSASFELAKTALTQYADLLKAAQADREKAASRRRQHAPGRASPAAVAQAGGAGREGMEEVSSRGDDKSMSSRRKFKVVTSFNKFDDVGLSDSVDSLNSDLNAKDFTDEEMEYETFDGEELNAVLEALASTHIIETTSLVSNEEHVSPLRDTPPFSPTPCSPDIEMENMEQVKINSNEAQVHAHYRLMDNEGAEVEEDDEDVQLEDSLMPDTLRRLTNHIRVDEVNELNKKNIPARASTNLIDEQGNFTQSSLDFGSRDTGSDPVTSSIILATTKITSNIVTSSQHRNVTDQVTGCHDDNERQNRVNDTKSRQGMRASNENNLVEMVESVREKKMLMAKESVVSCCSQQEILVDFVGSTTLDRQQSAGIWNTRAAIVRNTGTTKTSVLSGVNERILDIPDSMMISSGYMSDSSGGGSVIQTDRGEAGAGLLWRMTDVEEGGRGRGERQERPMSLVSSGSTDDTGFVDSDMMTSSMAAIDVNQETDQDRGSPHMSIMFTESLAPTPLTHWINDLQATTQTTSTGIQSVSVKCDVTDGTSQVPADVMCASIDSSNSQYVDAASSPSPTDPAAGFTVHEGGNESEGQNPISNDPRNCEGCEKNDEVDESKEIPSSTLTFHSSADVPRGNTLRSSDATPRVDQKTMLQRVTDQAKHNLDSNVLPDKSDSKIMQAISLKHKPTTSRNVNKLTNDNVSSSSNVPNTSSVATSRSSSSRSTFNKHSDQSATTGVTSATGNTDRRSVIMKSSTLVTENQNGEHDPCTSAYFKPPATVGPKDNHFQIKDIRQRKSDFSSVNKSTATPVMKNDPTGPKSDGTFKVTRSVDMVSSTAKSAHTRPTSTLENGGKDNRTRSEKKSPINPSAAQGSSVAKQTQTSGSRTSDAAGKTSSAGRRAAVGASRMSSTAAAAAAGGEKSTAAPAAARGSNIRKQQTTFAAPKQESKPSKSGFSPSHPTPISKVPERSKDTTNKTVPLKSRDIGSTSQSKAVQDDIQARLLETSRLFDEVVKERDLLVTSISVLKEEHRLAVEALSSQHKTELLTLKTDLERELQDKVDAVINRHSHEVNTLKAYHAEQLMKSQQEHQGEIEAKECQLFETIQALKTEQVEQLKVIEDKNTSQVAEMMNQFEEMKKNLTAKVERISDELNVQREQETARLEQATRRQADQAREVTLEVESLRVVLEQKNEDIRRFRQQVAQYEEKLSELPVLRETISKLEQKCENLVAVVDIKSDHEKQLSEMQRQLLRRCEKESKDKNRLSMNNEQLQWRLSQSETGDMMTSSMSATHCRSDVMTGSSFPTTGNYATPPRMSQSYDGSADHGRRHASPGCFTTAGAAGPRPQSIHGTTPVSTVAARSVTSRPVSGDDQRDEKINREQTEAHPAQTSRDK